MKTPATSYLAEDYSPAYAAENSGQWDTNPYADM